MNRLIWRRSIESDLAQGNRISANLLFEVGSVVRATSGI